MIYGFDLSKVTLERFKMIIQEGYLIQAPIHEYTGPHGQISAPE